MKRLTRSETDKKVAGVCSGFAEYADIDPVVVRAAYALLTIITGIFPGLIAYIILIWIIPSKSEVKG